MKKVKKSLVELSETSGFTTKEIWGLLAGGTTNNFSLADFVGEQFGIAQKTLMFVPAKRVRRGVLDWIAEHVNVSKQTAWRVLSREGRAGNGLSRLLEDFSGIPAPEWRSPTSENWMVKG